MQIQIANIPHPAQQTVLDSSARFRVLMCGRRFGKSLIAQIIALMKCGEGKKVAYITPTYLLAGVFFDALAKELPPTIYRNGSDKLIEFNGGQIRFFTGENLIAYGVNRSTPRSLMRHHSSQTSKAVGKTQSVQRLPIIAGTPYFFQLRGVKTIFTPFL
jgi:hypothetical protein